MYTGKNQDERKEGKIDNNFNSLMIFYIPQSGRGDAFVPDVLKTTNISLPECIALW